MQTQTVLATASAPQLVTPAPQLATLEDIPAILALINANPGNLLPRSHQDMVELLDTTWVIKEGDEVVGTVTLEIYSKKICELRTLAVHESCQGKGYGQALVQAVIDEYKRRGIHQLLTVTSSPSWFEKSNFGPCLREKFALFYQGDEAPAQNGKPVN